MSIPSPYAPSSSSSSQPSFEFTKRKRWPEIIITELSGVFFFLLNSSGKVLYCTAGVQDLLGWTDAEVINTRSIADLVAAEDARSFMSQFQQSMYERTELLSYARLNCKSQPYTSQGYHTPTCNPMLFEIKGIPHWIDSSRSSTYPDILFASAAPYPSRFVKTRDSYMDLKIENERLTQTVSDLRSQLPKDYAHSETSPYSSVSSSSGYSPRIITSSYQAQYDSEYSVASYQAAYGSDRSSSNYPYRQEHTLHRSYSTPNQVYGAPTYYESTSTARASSSSPITSLHPTTPTSPHPDEDEATMARKKRQRRVQLQNQRGHVCQTCGRTDSPEWRKGPQGPKTLCNACGLRWVKETKKKAVENNP